MNKTVKLMCDMERGAIIGQYANITRAEQEEAIRGALFEVIGNSKPGTKEYRQAMRRNEAQVYEIIEEMVDNLVINGDRVKNDFYDQFVETKNLALGDTNTFYAEGVNTLALAKFSGGHYNIARKRVDIGEEFSVETSDYGIAVFEYLDRFLAGRCDFATLIALMMEAIDKGISEACYAVFAEAITNIPTEFVFNGSYDEIGISETLGHVEAQNNAVPVLVGTRTSIAKLQGKVVDTSSNMKDQKNKMGILEYWNGYRCVTLPQVHKQGTFDFAFDDKKILALPAGVKLVKLVLEGDSQVRDEDKNADKTQTQTITFKMGIACAYAGMPGTITIA